MKPFYAVNRASLIYSLFTEQHLTNVRKKWFSKVSHMEPNEGYVKKVKGM